MSRSTSDHDLLFGLLALQNGIINQGQLVAAFQAWTLDRGVWGQQRSVGSGFVFGFEAST